MKPVQAILSTAILLASGSTMAEQIYKWIGANGKVNYSGTPPTSARHVENKVVTNVSTETGNLPYELTQAMKTYPVTLYTTLACTPCDRARAMLIQRGIPFSELTVTTAEDAQRMKEAGGDNTMPMLLVGRSKQIGFEHGAWSTTLTAAGYPEVSKLTQKYRNPTTGAAAPVAPKEDKDSSKADPVAESVETPPTPAADKPSPGFRF